jgi:hypothetical protein
MPFRKRGVAMSAEGAEAAGTPAGEPAKSEIDVLFERGQAIVEETRRMLAGFVMPSLEHPRSRRAAKRKAAAANPPPLADPEAEPA